MDNGLNDWELKKIELLDPLNRKDIRDAIEEWERPE